MIVLPYYQDDLVTLYHSDCLRASQWLSADYLVTDPPYGISYKPKRGSAIRGDHDTKARDEAIRLWGGRPAIIFGSWRAPRPAATRNILIWDKSAGNGPGMGDLQMPWGSAFEEIYILGRWKRPGTRYPNILRTSCSISSIAKKIGHPTPKPVELMEDLISQLPPGSIADPFAGAGSTLVAAKQQGRRAVGVDLDEAYCEIIAKRLEEI